MKKNSIIKGTCILTIAGFITRIIGFFYRIYLSNTLGAVKLGVYQLIFPIYGIAFTLYASGIQTAVSKMVADEYGKISKGYSTRSNINKILKTGVITGFIIAAILAIFLYFQADWVAYSLLKEKNCASSLRVLAFVFPFCSITSCINGYYYGLKRPGVPASTQLFEQIIRVTTVFIIVSFFIGGIENFTCEYAVAGVLAGEVASCIFNITAFSISSKKNQFENNTKHKSAIILPFLKYSVPLTGNHLIISVLYSVEAILIPAMLRKYGLTTTQALGVYGILTGMSLPFILFPSTITNSLSVLLLPAVSEASAVKDQKSIKKTAGICIQYCLIIGVFSTGIFIIFGSSLGQLFFHNQMAGKLLTILSWLCPFLYLSTTLGSIINGLGKTGYTLINTVAGLLIRIIFILVMVPYKGIYGYLIGLLCSTLTIALLDFFTLKKMIPLEFNAIQWILKPVIFMTIIGLLSYQIFDLLVKMRLFSNILLILVTFVGVFISYFILLILSGCIHIKDFK